MLRPSASARPGPSPVLRLDLTPPPAHIPAPYGRHLRASPLRAEGPQGSFVGPYAFRAGNAQGRRSPVGQRRARAGGATHPRLAAQAAAGRGDPLDALSAATSPRRGGALG